MGAATLLALADGLAAHVVGGYMTIETAIVALEGQLDAHFDT